MGFEGTFSINCISQSNGMAALWRHKDQCTVFGFSRNHIEILLSEEGHTNWSVTGYYCFPKQSRRRDSWNLLHHLSFVSLSLWCIIRDFNDILNADNKHGRVDHPIWLLCGFCKAD